MSYQNSLLRLFFCLPILILSIVSCKKTETPVTTPVVTTPKTSFTQSVYTLDSTGTPTPGVILTCPFVLTTLPTVSDSGSLLMMDQSGNVLNKVSTPSAAFDLNKWVINGHTRYTYIVNNPNALRVFGQDQFAGYAVIADSNLNTLQQINFTPFGQNLFQTGQALDVHEFILVSDSDYITLSYINKYVTNIPARLNPASNEPVVAPLIEEVLNGQVIFSWDGSQDTSFYANSVESNNFSDSVLSQDYMHMNSIFIDPTDNNLICSMRNQDQVIKINRQTGAIMWRLGGTNSDFALSPDQVFLRQHHATLTDNNQTLLIFDDGDATIRPSTRIVEFQLDQTNKLVNGFKYFDVPEPFTSVMGSVQKIGEEYFIGGGSANYMLEVNYNTGQKIMEYKGNQASYRSLKF